MTPCLLIIRSEMLVNMPNLFVKLPDGTPVAWAFLGMVSHIISRVALTTKQVEKGHLSAFTARQARM